MERQNLCLLIFVVGLALSLACQNGKSSDNQLSGKPSNPSVFVKTTNIGNYPQANRVARDNNKTVITEKAPVPKKAGHGFSATGIIVLIIGIILGVTAIYHFFIFYPIFCKKERKYQIMQMEKV